MNGHYYVNDGQFYYLDLLMNSKRKREGFDGQRAIVLPKNIIAVQCINNPVIGNAYITNIGYYPKAAFHYRRRLHGIDQNILVYCIGGSGWVELNDGRHEIAAGNFFIIPAMAAHSYGADEKNAWTIYWLHFKGDISDAMCASMIRAFNNNVGSVRYLPQRIQLFDEIYSTLERGYSHNNILYANMCLWHLVASFHFDNRFNIPDKKEGPDPVSKAIDFMQKNLSNTLTLQETASKINLSVSHFAAMFRKRTGFAPIEYFNHLKIQKACQYLHFTDDRINQIADQIGISDSYYFSRLFKKLMGASPAEYRKRIRK